jgi:hypothetical protein
MNAYRKPVVGHRRRCSAEDLRLRLLRKFEKGGKRLLPLVKSASAIILWWNYIIIIDLF